MTRVFVVDATVPRGGAYMAYHIGRLIHQQSGHPLIHVPITNIKGDIFDYDVPMTTIPGEHVRQSLTAQDIFICNPSAASSPQFGLRLPGKKIMYIQDFRTYAYLDCHFDIYACVSTLVQDFLRATYQLDVPVIPPFIDVSDAGQIAPWHTRPAHTALVYLKSQSREHMHVYQWLKQNLAVLYPELQLIELPSDYKLSHSDLMQKVSSARYLLNVCIAEGFGLVPLEAMALGTIPFGLNGLAGRDYMRYGENSFCLNYKDMNYENLQKLVYDMQQIQGFPDQEIAKARSYSQEAFYQNWGQLLSKHL